jgi:hypothetical protein
LILQNSYIFILILIFYISYTYGLYTNHIKFIYNIKTDYIIHHYTYHWSTNINVDYSQYGQINLHGVNKFWSLDLHELVQGFCHPCTTLNMTWCCPIKCLSCSNVWMYKNTKLKFNLISITYSNENTNMNY